MLGSPFALESGGECAGGFREHGGAGDCDFHRGIHVRELEPVSADDAFAAHVVRVDGRGAVLPNWHALLVVQALAGFAFDGVPAVAMLISRKR